MSKDVNVNFDENIPRPRCNTWPRRQQEKVEEGCENSDVVSESPKVIRAAGRKNVWGDLTYADLITLAIGNSPGQKLTLSEIYMWLIKNVPCLNEGNASSWKNSVRHNLSLHKKFVKVTNDGLNRSSWWTINYDAKPNKFVRRRCASMESGKLESIKKSRSKKQTANKTLMLSPTNGNLETQMFPEEARISKVFIQQSLPDSEVSIKYPVKPSIHPAFRRRTYSATSCGPDLSYSKQESSCYGNVNPPGILPGYHASPAYKSGILSDYNEYQNRRPHNSSNVHQGYFQSRPRSNAIGHQKRPVLNNIIRSNSYSNPQCREPQRNYSFNSHFEGFQEGYNPNFVEQSDQNWSEVNKATQSYLLERDENIQQPNFVEMQRSQNLIETSYFISKLTKNELDLGCGFTDVNQVAQNCMVNIDVPQEQSAFKEEVCQDAAVSSSYTFNCNIAEVIKNELEIDGTLDFL